LKKYLQILLALATINPAGSLVQGQSRQADSVLSWVEQEETVLLDQYLMDHDINTPLGTPATTLLVRSITQSGTAMTEWIIAKGADVNQKVNGISPLMYASGLEDVKKVRQLIDAGAEIDAFDPDGNSALFYAAINGNLKTARLLLKHGADISLKNHTWMTAYDMAVRNGQTETAQYLRSRYEKSLPDLLDGPYIRWKRNDRIRSLYLVHDSKSQLTRRLKSSFQATSDPYLLEGLHGDTLNYLVRSRKSPPPDEIQSAGRVMVMGDIHGGYDSLVLFLRENGVIGSSLEWRWDDGQLVFVGDIFDLGDKVTEALWLVYQLEDQAARSGGAVHFILGNHEIMVLTGDLSYASDKYLLMTSRLNLDYSALFSKRTILGQWLRSRNTVVRINRDLFVHAGLSPELVETGLGLHDLNKRVRTYLNHPDRNYREEDLRNELFGSPGPFWYRGYLEGNHDYPHLPDKMFEKVLDFYRGKRIFVGHTNVTNITSCYNGRAFAMDVPFYTYGNPIQGLLLEGNAVYLLNSSAEKRRIQ
jgi:hypothetical protein